MICPPLRWRSGGSRRRHRAVGKCRTRFRNRALASRTLLLDEPVDIRFRGSSREHTPRVATVTSVENRSTGTARAHVPPGRPRVTEWAKKRTQYDLGPLVGACWAACFRRLGCCAGQSLTRSWTLLAWNSGKKKKKKQKKKPTRRAPTRRRFFIDCRRAPALPARRSTAGCARP